MEQGSINGCSEITNKESGAMTVANTSREPKTGSGWPKPQDEMGVWLDSIGYYRKHTARDSSCLFRAISEQVFLTQAVHLEVKKQVLDFILSHPKYFNQLLPEDKISDYVDKMRNMREWGGLVEIQSAAIIYRCTILVWKDIGEEAKQIDCLTKPKKTLRLCLSHERHYDSVYTKQYITDLAVCQSVMYEALYKQVFKLEEVDYAVKKMLHDKSTKLQRDNPQSPVFQNCSRLSYVVSPGILSNFDDIRLEMRDNLLNVKDLLDIGITPFPYKVAKSLDSEIYRNVEFDVWNDYRKGVRYGLCEWTCKELQVGVKCIVHLEGGQSYQGHIQEMSPNKGPVVVFVIELGEKISVPYECLELLPPPSTAPSSTSQSANRPKRLSLTSVLKPKETISRCFESRRDSNSPLIVSSSNYFEERNEFGNGRYENYQMESGCPEETPDPDSSTNPMVNENGVYCLAYPDGTHIPIGLTGPHPITPDTADISHSDLPPVRLIYNVGSDQHVRMNYTMLRGVPYYMASAAQTVTTSSGGQSSYVIAPPVPLTTQQLYETSIPPTVPQTHHSSPAVIPVYDTTNTLHTTVPPPTSATGSRGVREVYEGQPLIQQYEVSTSSNAVGSVAVMPSNQSLPVIQTVTAAVHGPLPPPPPLAPAPLHAPPPSTTIHHQPYYYQPIEYCDPHHSYYPPPPPIPQYMDHYVYEFYPPVTAATTYPCTTEHMYYQPPPIAVPHAQLPH